MRSNRNRGLFIIWIILSLSALCSCGKSADISEYADDPITISGLLDEEFTITPAELLALTCVSRTATGKTAKAGTVSATGPLLDTFLAQYGFVPTDFEKIRFIAGDGYKTVLKGTYLTDYEVVLVVSSGEEPLAESLRPLRLLIPGAESNMWIYAVVRIEFEPAE